MDAALIALSMASLMYFGVWGIFLVIAHQVYKHVVASMKYGQYESVGEALVGNWKSIAIVAVLFLVASSISYKISSFGPKNVLVNPSAQQIEERLDQLKHFEMQDFEFIEDITPMTETAVEDAISKSRAATELAKKKFLGIDE